MESLLSQIEEIAKLGIYEVDLTRGVWTGSDQFSKIFGLKKKDLYTVAEFQALVHPEDAQKVMNYFGKCLQNKEDFNFEYRCIRPGGEIIYVNSRSKIQYSDEGAPLKVLGIKQDVTINKLFQLQLKDLNELDKKKNEILSVVAHDLRAPIAQILALSGLLKICPPSEQDDLIQLQVKSCEIAINIINELIEIAQLEHDDQEIKKDQTVVNLLIEESITRFQLIAQNKNITIKTSLCQNSEVTINSSMFARIIDNLLSNALKFTENGKSIELITENCEDQFLLRIVDQGIGIKPEHIPLLFEKFSKTIRRSGTQGEPSTGLGLCIVKHLVDLHSGTIHIESQIGKGTSITITFPK
jgi:two-component system sensor histidine kinase VicK